MSFTLTITVAEASTPVQTAAPIQTNKRPVITKTPPVRQLKWAGRLGCGEATEATSFVWRIVSADATPIPSLPARLLHISAYRSADRIPSA